MEETEVERRGGWPLGAGNGGFGPRRASRGADRT